MEFSQQLPEKWQALWIDAGFSEPSLIQAKSYPLLVAGDALLGVSPTGSGKTLAYLLPLLKRVKSNHVMQLVVLLPSQELAVQVAEVARLWSKPLDLNVQLIIGGANKKRQLEKLKEKPEIIIGTPGRIRELVIDRKLKIHDVEMLVLDEVDQLLTNREEANLTVKLVQRFPRNIQKVAFSATGQTATPLLKEYLDWDLPVLDVTQADTSQGEVQHLYIITEQRKRVEILRRLSHVTDFHGIVFFNQLNDLGAAEGKLLFEGVPVASLASDQNKLERKLAITAFKEQKIKLLLTSDIAARGLDFADLNYVVEYDIPKTKDSYTHRSGRVGRMGKKGCVITLIQQHQRSELQKISGADLQEVFLVGGKLTLEPPVKNEKLPTESAKTDVIKKKSENNVTKSETNKLQTTKPKKKKRQNKQKNRGARKHP